MFFVFIWSWVCNFFFVFFAVLTRVNDFDWVTMNVIFIWRNHVFFVVCCFFLFFRSMMSVCS
jgi:hypothetical protein